MTSRIFTASGNLDWKKAYMAAVMEKDRSRLPRLIHDAREKLAQRLHELWAVKPVASEEIEAIHDALYLLEALLSSLLYRVESGERLRAGEDS